ncbi:competence protein ComEC [Antricoccus suffuscus]|uniref:Competence protein ComEC n=1 Tax=Antricoccus suffuscus TaxID=1629062 RepID=A0A2T0Z4Z3_9ACTN|nr:ComEC/Rec2 family competence protein [Antricoccus suffuscus]PRZ31403.1 competence protein ComEC [Antricoccus suffuscus]
MPAERLGGDFRLVPAAGLAWICTIITNSTSRAFGWWAFAIAAVASAVAGAAMFAPKRWLLGVRDWWVLPVLLAGAAALAALTVGLIRQSEALSSPLREAALHGRYVEVEGAVATDPRVYRNQPSGTPPRMVVTVDVSVLETGHTRYRLDGQVVVIGSAKPWLGKLPGQKVVLSGMLSLPLRGGVDAMMSERGPPRFVGQASIVQRVAGTIRTDLAASSQRALAPDAAAVLTALVDGDVSEINPIIDAQFKQTGLSHLMAVSGANVAIITGAGLWLARRTRLPFMAQIGFAACLLIAFVLVARPEPSVLRAAAMGVVTLIALASGRPRAAIPALAAAVIVLLFVAPSLATAAGFALSVVATGGIVIFSPPWTARLSRYMPKPLAMAVAVAASAGLATAPIIVTLYPMLNLVSIPANLLAAPVVAPATILGVIAAVSATWWPALADACCWLAGFSVRWLIGVADRASAIPEARIDWPAGLTGAGLLVGCFIATAVVARATRSRPGIRAAVAGIVVGGLVVSIPIRAAIRPWPPTDWLVVACDVGQGDAVVIHTGDGSAIVVDTGPESVSIDRCLTELGIDSMPMILLSHLHEDHIGGLEGAVRGRSVAEIDVSPLHDPISASQRVDSIATKLGVPVRDAVRGEQRYVSDVRITVIGPVQRETDTHSDPNNNSVLVRVDVRGFSFLLPGDAEIEEQTDIIGEPALLDVDVLKVPHHGSAYQLKDFFAATTAQIALVSVGAGNTYGHPSPLTMATLASLGMDSYRTDLQGDLAVTVVGGKLEVVTHEPVVPPT